MRRIPRGQTRSYQEVANVIGKPLRGPGCRPRLRPQSGDGGDSLPSRYRQRRLGPRQPALHRAEEEVAGGREGEELKKRQTISVGRSYFLELASVGE